MLTISLFPNHNGKYHQIYKYILHRKQNTNFHQKVHDYSL